MEALFIQCFLVDFKKEKYMWCPNCRNEYREGITECADCHVPLVPFEELGEEIKEDATFDAGFVNWANSHSKELESIIEKENSADNMIDEENIMQIMVENNTSNNGPFVSKADRTKEYLSSGYTLVIVGGAGLLAMILVMAGIIPLHLASNIKYISYGVMSIMFIIFIVVGIKCLKDAKALSVEADIEKSLFSEVKSWFLESFSKEEIEEDAVNGSGLSVAEVDDIDIYYRVSANIKAKITARYSELDEEFLEQVAEELYQELFEA